MYRLFAWLENVDFIIFRTIILFRKFYVLIKQKGEQANEKENSKFCTRIVNAVRIYAGYCRGRNKRYLW